MFKSAVEVLIKSLDDDGKNSFENFVFDFLSISGVSFKNLFDVKKSSYESKERKKILLMLKFIIKAKKIDLK